MSLDGVVQDPDGGEGFRLGRWFGEFGGKDLQGWAQVEAEEALGADALLLGRRSDEWFAWRWLSRDGAWADKLNGMPKYVVSSTLADPKWSNSTVLKHDVVSEVSRLKQQIAGEILIYASSQLVRTLIEHDLVDELRLVIFRSCSGRRPPLRRNQRQEADASPQREQDRRRARVRHIRVREGSLTAQASSSLGTCRPWRSPSR